MRNFDVFRRIEEIAVFIDGWMAGVDGAEYLSAKQAIDNLSELGYPTTPENVDLYLNGVEDGLTGDAFRIDASVEQLKDMARTIATLIEWRQNTPCA